MAAARAAARAADRGVPLCLAASSGGRCGAQVRSQPGILRVEFTRKERTLIFARLSKVESEFTRIALGFQ